MDKIEVLTTTDGSWVMSLEPNPEESGTVILVVDNKETGKRYVPDITVDDDSFMVSPIPEAVSRLEVDPETREQKSVSHVYKGDLENRLISEEDMLVIFEMCIFYQNNVIASPDDEDIFSERHLKQMAIAMAISEMLERKGE